MKKVADVSDLIDSEMYSLGSRSRRSIVANDSSESPRASPCAEFSTRTSSSAFGTRLRSVCNPNCRSAPR